MVTPQEIINEDIKEIVSDLKKDLAAFSGKTILIAGSNGLLGRYMLDAIKYLNDHDLLNKPAKVIGLNKSKTKKSSENYKYIKHDISKPYHFTEKIDYIIHSAGFSSPAVFQKDPLNTIDVNVEGTRCLLELAKGKKVKSMIYLSSGEIYGSPDEKNTPTPETYNGNSSPLDKRACYIESKRLAETLCKIYYDNFKVPVKIVRPFVIYGPGVRTTDKKVLSDFMQYAINKKPIEMLSEGSDLRSDCYISDATSAFLRILLSSKDGEVYNVGSDRQEFSIKELAQNIHKICGIKESPIYRGAVVPDHLKSAPKRFSADITKIRKELGFSPKINLKEGLKRTIEWNKLILKKGKNEK